MPLTIAVLHKKNAQKQGGNVRVTLAGMDMTRFFNQACLQHSLALMLATTSFSLQSEEPFLSPCICYK